MRLVLHTPGVVEGEEQTVVQLCESGRFFYLWTTSTAFSDFVGCRFLAGGVSAGLGVGGA